MGMESKLWNIVRVVLFMLKKGTLKSKIMVVKRGKAVAGSLMLHHHYVAALTCRSHDSHLSFVSPGDYEFSCSNSPTFAFHANKRKHHRRFTRVPRSSRYDDASTAKAVQKVLIEMLNRENVEAANLPLVTLPAFGKSPTGKQLRITDSPFAVNDDDVDGDAQVDKAAEEFINKFYRDLDLQRTMAAHDSPSHYFWDR